MKKGLIVLFLTLALLVLVSPGIVGRLAERGMDDSLEWAANEQGEIIVTSSGFERGWFNSAGQHRIELIRGELYDSTLAALGRTEQDLLPVLLIDTRLDHGLIPVSSLAREHGSLLPGLGSAVSTLSIEMSDGSVVALPGKFFSSVGLTGVLQSRFLLEPEGADTEAARIDWGLAEFVATADALTGNLAFRGSLNSVAVETAGETTIVGKLDVDIDLTDSGFGFMVGPAKISLDSFAVIGADETMSAGPLYLDSDSSLDDGRVNADVTLRLENIPFPTGGSGGVHIVAHLENIDAIALGQLTRSLETARTTEFNPLTTVGVQRDLKLMLASGMKIRFDHLDVSSPFGEITSNLSASVARSADDDYSWATAMMALDATANVSLPAALVDLATQYNPDLHAAIGMGFLRKRGQFYTMEAAFKQGLLTVNGAPMPIPLAGLQ